MPGYSRNFACVYDKLNQAVDYAVIAETLCAIADRYGAKKGLLLDLACGTGRLAAALSARGYEVIAVDGSPDMLSEAAARPAAGKPVLYLCQPMTGLDLYGTVGVAVCTMDSLNHLVGPEELDAVFARLHLFVEPGGLLLFDMNTPYKHRTALGDNTFVLNEGGIHCVWQNRYHPENDRVDIALEFTVRAGDGVVTGRDSFSEFACEDAAVEALLQKNGFVLEEVRGGYPFDGEQARELRHLFTARRK